MNRRTFALTPLLLPPILFGAEKKEKVNICELNSIDLMADNIIYKRAKSKLKCRLNKKENEAEFLILIEKIDSNPFDEESVEKAMDILINDTIKSDVRLFTQNNQYKNNDKLLMIIIDSFMFIKSNKLKLKAVSLMEMEEVYNVIKNEYLKPTYKNYLIYLNLGQDTKEIKPKLLDNDIKDMPYRLYYKVMHNVKNENIDITRKLNSCFAQQTLISLSNSYTSKDAFELFALSKMYPEKSTQLLNLFYAISDNTNIMEFLDLNYNLLNNKFILASTNIENIYLIDKKEYLKRPMVEIYFNGSKEAYAMGDLYKAWTLQAKAISTLIDTEDRIDSDANLLNNLKSNFKSLSADLVKEYKRSNNNSNAKFIEDQSNSLLKKSFFISRTVKKIS